MPWENPWDLARERHRALLEEAERERLLRGAKPPFPPWRGRLARVLLALAQRLDPGAVPKEVARGG